MTLIFAMADVERLCPIEIHALAQMLFLENKMIKQRKQIEKKT